MPASETEATTSCSPAGSTGLEKGVPSLASAAARGTLKRPGGRQGEADGCRGSAAGGWEDHHPLDMAAANISSSSRTTPRRAVAKLLCNKARRREA